ncbi:MAG: cyclopropane-fatty-acyl-phospholipid synthase, partial [Myxococcota bacterium]
EGLDDRVEYIAKDYREISGNCDAFVSVGMLEHVGVEHYAELGQVINRCLSNRGIGLIHTIGQNLGLPMNSWIERHIFPGAYPPTLSQIVGILQPHNFSVLDVENLRLHYARTLNQWLERYERQIETTEAEHDSFFARAWRFYLAGSQATFLTGRLQLFQVVFSRHMNNAIPLTRQHLTTR